MRDGYKIRAIPTRYRGLLFRSRLEARYAAFFDLAGWSWEYEPIDLDGWIPDFLVRFPCGHSECPKEHAVLAEVKPYLTLEEFEGHPCLDYGFGGYDPAHGGRGFIPADASAAFGYHPRVSWWEMAHGAGGGEERIEEWVHGDMNELWAKAGEAVMYRKPGAT